uniref:SEC7 domain-containing protein n=1 Tax=Steinernema glaseri TaxID=37863 RepID=A0A1I7YFG3_9BILA
MLCHCGKRMAMPSGGSFHDPCCPIATPTSQFLVASSTAMRTMISASSSRTLATYELSDDLSRRQIQVLERRYGGRIRAHAAATKIQRAFREYRMTLQFRRITAHSNASQRGARRCAEYVKGVETPYFRESFRPTAAQLTHNALSQPSLRYQPSTSLLTQLRVEREEIHAERPTLPDQRLAEVSMRVRRSARSPPAPSLMAAFGGPVSRPYIELMSPRLSNRRLVVPHQPPSAHAEGGGGRSTSPLVWVPRVQSTSSSSTATSHHSTASHTNSLPRVNRGNSSSHLAAVNGGVGGLVKPRDCAMLKWTDQQRRRYYRIALNFFNKKPDRGIQMLINWGFIENNPVAIAKLLTERRGLSKQMIGEFIGTLHSAFHADVLHSFVAEVDMRDMEIDIALRQTLMYFRLPGEAQKIDRIMQVFSQRYCKCNPSSSAVQCGPDAIYILAFAIIMLNTDLHSPSVKQANKMKMEDFIKNIQGTKDGLLLERDLLVGIYERIRETPFVQGEDHVNQVSAIDKRLVGKDKPKLAEAYRRLICSCRFYQIADVNKKQSADAHQREVYLFNDMIVIAKLLNKKKGNASPCTLKHWSSTVDMKIEPFRTQHYKHGLLISCPGGMQILLNSRSDDDRYRFLADARESAAESTEMEQIRIEMELDKQSMLSLNRSESQRDSGLPEFENGDAKNGSKNGSAKPSRRLSFNSLDSGMVEEGGDLASP